MWLVLIPFLLILIPDIYIWHFFVREFQMHTLLKVLYWVPLAFATFTCVAWATGLHQMWIIKVFFFLLLCIALPKLVFMLISVIGKGGGLLLPYIAWGANVAGVLSAFAIVIMSFYGFTYGWKRFIVKEVNISSVLIPKGFNGYRIVQLSDLHIGTFAHSPEAIEDLVDRVNALKPDLIVFTGDIVNSSPNELEPFAGILSQLDARDGIYSVMGNHDYCLYQKYEDPRDQVRNMNRVIDLQDNMGWQLLMNDNVTLHRGDEQISLIGVENAGRPPFPSHSDLNKAMEGIPSENFKILLTHDPTHWRREVLNSSDIQLSLAGHTHAMQFKIGPFSPSSWAYDEWEGLHNEGNQQLYISHGTGGNVPFRFGAWPEITLITLHR